MLFKINKLYIFTALALIAGCKQIPMLPGVTPHRIDIQQGNAITQEMVSKLQPGMTRAQVRFVLGTPLVVDLFHNDRWDYVYTYNKRGELIEQRRMIVFFKDDKLDRIEGDVIPAKPKPDAVKPAAKPDTAKPEIAKPDAATPAPVATPTATPATPAVTPAAAPAQAAVPGALAAPDSKPAGSAEIPPAMKPAAPAPDSAPAPVEKPVADKPLASPPAKPEAASEEKKGLFARMLEKIGF